MNDNKKRIRLIVYSGIIAALYVVLTLPMAQFAFGPIQFRLAEVLTVLPAFAAGYIPGVSLGCFLANLLNPNNLGPVDIICGTLATVIAGIFTRILGKKNKILGIIPPVVFNGLIVGGYLPFLLVDEGSEVTAAAVGLSMFEVAASEAVLLVIVGIPFILLLEKNSRLKSLVEKL
jgi:uncharacterized membrane protein